MRIPVAVPMIVLFASLTNVSHRLQRTDLAANDRESHPAYPGNLNLSDIDDRCQLYSDCAARECHDFSECHQCGNLRRHDCSRCWFDLQRELHDTFDFLLRMD